MIYKMKINLKAKLQKNTIKKLSKKKRKFKIQFIYKMLKYLNKKFCLRCTMIDERSFNKTL